MKLGSIFLLLVVAATPATALDSDIRKLMQTLDCDSHRLSPAKASARITSPAAVWVLVNEGPSSVAVVTTHDNAVVHVVRPRKRRDNINVFVGDTRFKYALVLPQGTKGATIHACVNS